MNRLLVGAVAVAIATTAAIAPSAQATERAAHAAATAHITISDFGYSGDLTVTPGEHVVVTNQDSVAHTLTDKRTHLFDTGSISANGGTGTFTAPAKAGSYAFGCTFHPEMAGTLVVRSAQPAKVATMLSTQRAVTIAKGHSTTLHTTLADKGSRRALGHVTITLLSRANSHHAFRTVRSVTTNVRGQATLTVRPAASVQYEWHYAGDSRHLASHSGLVRVGVR